MESSAGLRLRIASWNVLAQRYAEMSVSGHLPRSAVEWRRRKRQSAALMVGWQADVVCLQEVDHYADFWKKALADSLGMHSRYQKRPHKRDGLVMGWSKKKLALLSYKALSYDELVSGKWPGANPTRHHRHNVAQMALLQQKGGDKACFLLLNTHLFWNPTHTDVKVMQMYCLLTEANGWLASMGRASVPILLCGDLNSLPSSAVVQLATLGCITEDHEDAKKYLLTRCKEFLKARGWERAPAAKRKVQKVCRFWREGRCTREANCRFLHVDGAVRDKEQPAHPILESPFALASAFQGEFFTNYTEGFRGIIDWILYSPNHWRVVSKHVPQHDYAYQEDEDFDVLRLKQNKAPQQTRYELLPSETFPSDHLPLLVTMELIDVRPSEKSPAESDEEASDQPSE